MSAPLSRAVLALEQAAESLGDALARRHSSMEHCGTVERCTEHSCWTTRSAMQYAHATATELREESQIEERDEVVA